MNKIFFINPDLRGFCQFCRSGERLKPYFKLNETIILKLPVLIDNSYKRAIRLSVFSHYILVSYANINSVTKSKERYYPQYAQKNNIFHFIILLLRTRQDKSYQS
jgi:hypothetical protein